MHLNLIICRINFISNIRSIHRFIPLSDIRESVLAPISYAFKVTDLLCFKNQLSVRLAPIGYLLTPIIIASEPIRNYLTLSRQKGTVSSNVAAFTFTENGIFNENGAMYRIFTGLFTGR